MASEEPTNTEIELNVVQPEQNESSPLTKEKTQGLSNGSKVN